MGNNSIWVIAYINRDHIGIAKEELKHYGHHDIEAYIPTVRLLKKKFKGKDIFEFVPLLFNYGFFKVPLEKAKNPEYLMTLRHHITCIYAWVKDPARINPNRSGLKIDNSNFDDALPQCATATDQEVARMVETSQSMSIYNEEDLKKLNVGDYIKLQGYPYDNMPAEIKSINHKKGHVKVLVELSPGVQTETQVSFENVFYTIYKNYEEEGKEESTEEINNRVGYGLTDNLLFNEMDYTDE